MNEQPKKIDNIKEAGDNNNEKNTLVLETVEDDTLFRFENINDILKGIFSEQGYSDRWKRPIYTISTKTGDKRVLGKEQLDRLMKKVSIGDYIEITYIDDMTTPLGAMKIFEIKKQKQ